MPATTAAGNRISPVIESDRLCRQVPGSNASAWSTPRCGDIPAPGPCLAIQPAHPGKPHDPCSQNHTRHPRPRRLQGPPSAPARGGPWSGRSSCVGPSSARPSSISARRWMSVRIPISAFPPGDLVFEGAIDHRDSIGSFSTIRPGQVNLMTAGRGIVHRNAARKASAMPAPGSMACRPARPCPTAGRNRPAFEAVKRPALIEDQCVTARVIMSELWGLKAAHHHYARRSMPRSCRPSGAIRSRPMPTRRGCSWWAGKRSLDGRPLDLYVLTVLAPRRGDGAHSSAAGG